MISRYLNRLPASIRQRDKKKSPPIQTPTLPNTLIFPIPDECDADRILVRENDRVLRGQALTCSDNYLIPPIHASSSGAITTIDSTHITITTDGKDEWVKTEAAEKIPDRDQLAQIAHETGLIGQGGAGFPLAAKLNAQPANNKLLLVNAAECDPVICCDDALIQHKADSIVHSIDTIATCQGIDHICIGIEDNKQEAIDALRAALAAYDKPTATIDVVVVPACYPSGAEQILLKLCSHIAQITGENLAEAGILSMNIASCDAFGEALRTGRPCTDRVTTIIVPDGNSYNFRLRLGTTVDYIYDCLNQEHPLSTIERITTGGEMMYQAISASDSISQTSNCITFETNAPADTLCKPCIRCGVCATACPEDLMPQHLHTYTINFNQRQLLEHNINRCIECRCCDIVCPSQIPLAEQFHSAKKKIATSIQGDIDAKLARTRYEKRLQRLANRDGTKRRKIKQPPHIGKKPANSHQALIEAALARKQKRRRGDH